MVSNTRKILQIPRIQTGSGLFTRKTVSKKKSKLRKDLINELKKLVRERIRECGPLKTGGPLSSNRIDYKKKIDKLIKKLKKYKNYDESIFSPILHELDKIVEDLDEAEFLQYPIQLNIPYYYGIL